MSDTITENKYSNVYSKFVYIVMIVGFAILVIFDQFTKRLAVSHLKDSQPFVLINNVLELRYLENQGAAFGMLQNKQIFFYILTIVFIAIIIYLLIKMPKNRYYLPLMCGLVVLAAGALGNFIDRFANKYVVDFIYFSLIDFPIFNVADIYVTLSVIYIAVIVIFKYKDGDFAFVSPQKPENR